jgi:hypothetical protein
MIASAVMGFLIGLSPRIASILIGETSRGGQGHDMDILPTKLLVHLQDFLTKNGPELLGFGKSFHDLTSNPTGMAWAFWGILFIFLIAIFFFSALFLVSENRTPLKNIVALRGMEFKAVHVILLMPILVCVANIIIQHGPETRYLFPLFGVITLWVGIYVDKIKEKFKWFPVAVLAIWIGFYSFANYQAFQAKGLIEGNKVVKLNKHFIHSLIDFLDTEKITVAYSSYGITGIGSYFSGGRINISEYSSNPTYKTRQRKKSLTSPSFAIIAKDKNATVYQNYLQEKRIEFKTMLISGYQTFWDFSGDNNNINRLRSLIHTD